MHNILFYDDLRKSYIKQLKFRAFWKDFHFFPSLLLYCHTCQQNIANAPRISIKNMIITYFRINKKQYLGRSFYYESLLIKKFAIFFQLVNLWILVCYLQTLHFVKMVEPASHTLILHLLQNANVNQTFLEIAVRLKRKVNTYCFVERI